MPGHEELLADILQAGDGKIVGRIRLQKIAYLLEQMGMEGGFGFTYHHYGPYSEDLARAIDFAHYVHRSIRETEEQGQVGTYSIFTLRNPFAPAPPSLGSLPWDRARGAIREMKAETSVVIEIAATIHWLKHKEKVEDWRSELKIRKPGKADDATIERALKLLERLDLAA